MPKGEICIYKMTKSFEEVLNLHFANSDYGTNKCIIQPGSILAIKAN